MLAAASLRCRRLFPSRRLRGGLGSREGFPERAEPPLRIEQAPDAPFSGERRVAIPPRDELFHIPHLAPIVDKGDRETLEERVEGGALGDDDRPEIERLPCPVAVLAHPGEAEHQ